MRAELIQKSTASDVEQGSTKEQSERGEPHGSGDDQTKDREGRMDREAGVERGGETLEARRTRDSVQSDASGGLGQRPREGMGLFGDTVDQRRETRNVATDLRIRDLSSPDSSDCHARSLQPHWVEATRSVSSIAPPFIQPRHGTA